MADKPIYYGSPKSSPIYYGASSPMYGSSKSPVYYNSKPYGQYGAYGGVGGVGGPGNDKSLVGRLTMGRILRFAALAYDFRFPSHRYNRFIFDLFRFSQNL